MLAENEGRWESLSATDRERLAAMAKAIASRLLHDPTLRMKRAAGSDDAYLYVSALRELFGLDAETEPERGEPGRTESARAIPEGFRLTSVGSSCAMRATKNTRVTLPDRPH